MLSRFSRPSKLTLLLVLALAILLLAGLIANSLWSFRDSGAVNDGDEPQTYNVVDCKDDQPQCQPVLDCTSDRTSCISRKVRIDIEACAKKEERQKCINFANRLPTVSLISDSYNFVSAAYPPAQVSAEILNDNLKLPWDIEILPDGSMLVTEKEGKIKHISADGTANVVLTLEVITTHEAGLMGLTLDPDFAENGYVYAAYTYKLDDTDPDFAQPKMWTHQRVLNKVTRWTFKDGKFDDATLILDGLPGSVEHCGLRIDFGPDGKLYVSTGDATRWLQSEELDFLGGKILRVNADGSIPADNPDPTSYVYSRGHRNPQGMAWDPTTGHMYASEHGPERFDEINRIEAGGNYGWGNYKCDTKMAKHAEPEDRLFPVVCFRQWNISPSGMTFVADPDSSWYGSLFVAGLRGKHLHRYEFSKPGGDEVELDEIFYVSRDLDSSEGIATEVLSRRFRDVEYFDGALYIIGDVHGLAKLTPIVN